MTLTTQIRLTVRGRRTAAYLKLLDGLEPAGANVARRQKGYSDYDVICRLVDAGWLECRQGAGPRGGARWYTTPAGAAALSEGPRA